jgi:hypothetical protein
MEKDEQSKISHFRARLSVTGHVKAKIEINLVQQSGQSVTLKTFISLIESKLRADKAEEDERKAYNSKPTAKTGSAVYVTETKFNKSNKFERLDLSERFSSNKDKYDHSVCFKNPKLPPYPCYFKDSNGKQCGLLHWRNEHGTERPEGRSSITNNKYNKKSTEKSTSGIKSSVDDLISQVSKLSPDDYLKLMVLTTPKKSVNTVICSISASTNSRILLDSAAEVNVFKDRALLQTIYHDEVIVINGVGVAFDQAATATSAGTRFIGALTVPRIFSRKATLKRPAAASR